MFHPTLGIKGLYAITPDCSDTPELVSRVRLALEGGAHVLQYRSKKASAALRLEQARALRILSRQFGVPFIVNDDVSLALAVEADGVHLGADDGAPDAARAALGRGKILGVSCYNRPSLARAALAGGADYVAFGAFFPSSVKPDAVAADVAMLRRLRAELGAPIVAIGGITADNGAALLSAGADALAVISALFDAPDIRAAARDFAQLFNRNPAS